jgi:hypothetical protein
MEIKRKRDFAYVLAVKSKQSNDWFKYKELRNLFQKQSRIKHFKNIKENYIKINKEFSFNHIDDDTVLDN